MLKQAKRSVLIVLMVLSLSMVLPLELHLLKDQIFLVDGILFHLEKSD